jgi:hypothetical protein
MVWCAGSKGQGAKRNKRQKRQSPHGRPRAGLLAIHSALTSAHCEG